MHETAEAWSAIPMVTDMKESLSTVNLTGKASTPGPTAKCTRASGPSASRKAKASGRASSVTLILASGNSQKLQVMECISGRMEIGTRASGRTVSNMDKDLTFSPTATAILAPTRRESPKAQDSINGKMAASTSENSKMG